MFIFIEQLPVVFSWCSKDFGETCHDTGHAESALWITPSLEMRFPVKQLFISRNKCLFPSLLYFVSVLVHGI